MSVLLPAECVIPEDAPDQSPARNGPVVLLELGTVDGCGAPEAVLMTVGEHVYRFDRASRLGVMDEATGRWLSGATLDAIG